MLVPGCHQLQSQSVFDETGSGQNPCHWLLSFLHSVFCPASKSVLQKKRKEKCTTTKKKIFWAASRKFSSLVTYSCLQLMLSPYYSPLTSRRAMCGGRRNSNVSVPAQTTYKQTNKQTDKQTDRQTDRQTNKQTTQTMFFVATQTADQPTPMQYLSLLLN